ncbi:MAG: C25 family cysteine peptidase [Kiritimatiellae bacterium]|nr:C25 family cysteine peptidase [Kiritimatiellia bacterium]
MKKRLFIIIAAAISCVSPTLYAREWVQLTQPSALRAAASAGKPVDAIPTDGVAITTNAPGQFGVRLQVNGFWKRPRNAQAAAQGKVKKTGTADASTYDAVQIPGWTTLQRVGEPAIPIRRLLFPLPAGCTEASVTVRSKSDVSVGTLNIIPAQPPYLDVYPEPPRPAFQADAATYRSSTFFPPDNIVATEVIYIRDQAICVVDVASIRFVPDSGEAVAATELDLDVTAINAINPGLDPEPAASALPIYMILMDDQFATNSTLLSLIDWKKRKGYDVRTVETSEIDPSGAPTNGQIVAYMRGLAASNYPTYLLILGDHTASNGVQGEYFSTYEGGYTDLSIACQTTNDWIPDLYYGRLPATNETSATRMLEKVLAMDRSPPTSDMFTKTTIAGQIQDSDDYNNRADRLFCETGDALATYFEQDPSGIGTVCTRAVVNPDGMTAEGNWAWDGYYNSILWGETNQIGDRIFTNFVSVATAQARINATVNAGVALLFHRDHGYSNGVGWADPQYIYTHVRALTNGVNRPVVFSINCNSGAYHVNNNFARAWIEHTNGGACAVFAPVDTSYSWLNDWLTHGLMVAFLTNYLTFQNNSTDPEWSNQLPAPNGAYGAAGSAQSLGAILNFAKLYMYEKFYPDKTTFRLFHVFGDPEAALLIGTPAPLSVNHTPVITLGSNTVAVSVSETGAVVCLYSSALGIHERQTAATTNLSFSVSPSASGIIYVTATKPGRRPSESTITATTGESFSSQATALTNNIILRWTDPLLCGGASRLVNITMSTNDYPDTSSDGVSVYSGTNTVYDHTGLTPGQTYYYTIWITQDGSTWTNPP